MKIDSRGVIPIDSKRIQADKKTKSVEAPRTEQSRPRNEEEIAKALQNTVADIEKSGLSAAAVHSEADTARISGFLKSIDVQAKQPRLSDSDVLKLADKVAKDSQQNAAQASAAFNTPDSSRVAELV